MRLVPELALRAKGAIEGSLAMARLALRQHFSGRAIIGSQAAHAPSAQRSGQLDPKLRIHNAPRKEELFGEAEYGRVFQEEGASLRKDHLIALINLHLRIVGTDLAEVRIQRHIEREGVTDDSLCV